MLAYRGGQFRQLGFIKLRTRLAGIGLYVGDWNFINPTFGNRFTWGYEGIKPPSETGFSSHGHSLGCGF
jgi:hypothetical protein